MLDKIKCLLGAHDWKLTYHEYREHEYRGTVITDQGNKHYFDGIVSGETCKKCGCKKYTKYGFTTIRKR